MRQETAETCTAHAHGNQVGALPYKGIATREGFQNGGVFVTSLSRLHHADMESSRTQNVHPHRSDISLLPDLNARLNSNPRARLAAVSIVWVWVGKGLVTAVLGCVSIS